VDRNPRMRIMDCSKANSGPLPAPAVSLCHPMPAKKHDFPEFLTIYRFFESCIRFIAASSELLWPDVVISERGARKASSWKSGCNIRRLLSILMPSIGRCVRDSQALGRRNAVRTSTTFRTLSSRTWLDYLGQSNEISNSPRSPAGSIAPLWKVRAAQARLGRGSGARQPGCCGPPQTSEDIKKWRWHFGLSLGFRTARNSHSATSQKCVDIARVPFQRLLDELPASDSFPTASYTSSSRARMARSLGSALDSL
jgi:hypothetical protein